MGSKEELITGILYYTFIVWNKCIVLLMCFEYFQILDNY